MAFHEDVILPGYLIPGVMATAEIHTKTVTLDAADTYGDLTFALASIYDRTPAIMGIPMLTPGAESATTMITAVEVTAQSTAAITVRVHVDAAAGGTATNTITMVGAIIGKQGR